MARKKALFAAGTPPRVAILVVEDNQRQRKDIIKRGAGIVSALVRDGLDVVIEFVDTGDSGDALKLFERDGEIQAVLLDWYLDKPGQENRPAPEKEAQHPSKRELVEALRQVRPEVPIYVMTVKKSGFEVVDTGVHIKNFFSKEEIRDNLDSVLKRIVSDFDERRRAPFWERYKEYIVDAKDGWHTPGHSGGCSFQSSPYLNRFHKFFGSNYFLGDLSVSVEGLGSLLDSTGFVGEAQRCAARTFQVKHTFFATNGSSTSNKIILQTILRPGDKAIVDRNCHKSIHYGIISCGARPIYLESAFDPGYGIFAPPSLKEIEERISSNYDAKALVLTGCTYDGMLLDLRKVVNMARGRGIKVFVDEAWFAYSLFHPLFRDYSAIASGADYITHSAHKVLSAFSQASLIHVNDPEFDEDFFRENFYIYTSTSPQYTMIASLDVARMQMEIEGYKRISDALELANSFRKQLSSSPYCRIVCPTDLAARFSSYEEDHVGFDPLKVLVDISSTGLSIEDVHAVLQNEGGLEIEKTTGTTFLVLFTIGATSAKMTRIYRAIKEIERLAGEHVGKQLAAQRGSKPIPPLECEIVPRDAFYKEKDRVKLGEAGNRVAAGLVTPYPPGIPLWVPGQRISEAHISYLDEAINIHRREVHGCHDGYVYVIR